MITDATAPEQVAGITDVTGSVLVENTTQLADLGMLADLECVDGGVRIEFNAGLVSLAGLENLRRVVGGIELEWNENLASADALMGVERLGGLQVADNPSLPTMPRFADGVVFASVGAVSLEIYGDNGFTDLDPLLEMQNIEVDADLLVIDVFHESTLRDARGLTAFAGTSADVLITFLSTSLREIDLTGFGELARLQLYAPALQTLLAPDLQHVDFIKVLDVGNAGALQPFAALETADTLIVGCGSGGPTVTDLDGLQALQSVGNLAIVRMSDLETLSPLPTTLDVAELWIVENGSLTETEAEAYADAVAPTEDATVCSNLGDPDPCVPSYGIDLCNVKLGGGE